MNWKGLEDGRPETDVSPKGAYVYVVGRPSLRRRGQPAVVIAIAGKAQQRLYRRQRHLATRGKTPTQAVQGSLSDVPFDRRRRPYYGACQGAEAGGTRQSWRTWPVMKVLNWS